jgi:hypothetical protein
MNKVRINGMSNKKFGISLDKIISRTEDIQQIPKGSLSPGDYVFVKTINSLYSICKKDDQLFEVCGGWFDRNGLSPAVIPIRGCTWGGSIINISIIAAKGLFLEFGNNLTTSPIRKIVVIRSRQLN